MVQFNASSSSELFYHVPSSSFCARVTKLVDSVVTGKLLVRLAHYTRKLSYWLATGHLKPPTQRSVALRILQDKCCDNDLGTRGVARASEIDSHIDNETRTVSRAKTAVVGTSTLWASSFDKNSSIFSCCSASRFGARQKL